MVKFLIKVALAAATGGLAYVVANATTLPFSPTVDMLIGVISGLVLNDVLPIFEK